MPMNVTPGANNLPIDVNGAGGANAGAPVNPVVAKPGFKVDGQPLGDAEVWNTFVGEGAKARPVNTAALQGKKSIDLAEAKALAELAMNSPQEFALRLLADSSNGTPIALNFSKKVDKVGIGRVSFKAENGQLTSIATLEIYNKSVDDYLKAYLAKDAREKGTRSKITLEVNGKINADGGLEDISAKISASNLPKLSAEKLMQLDKIKDRIKNTLEGDGTAAEKQTRVQEMVTEALKEMSEIPIGFFVDLITNSRTFKADIQEDSHNLRAHAEAGKGAYAITFTDLLDSENKNEADLGARIAGSVGEDKDTIKVGDISVYTTDKLALDWDADGKAVVSKVGADGQKTQVDDHAAQILMYFPVALGFLTGRRNDPM